MSDGKDLDIPPVLPVPQAVAVAAPVVVAVPMVLPAGLQVLADADGFYIRQKAQWLEEFTGYEKKNKYQVRGMPPPSGICSPQGGGSKRTRKLEVACVWTFRNLQERRISGAVRRL